eukprot:RCo045786
MNVVFLDIDGVVRPYCCGMEFDVGCMNRLRAIVTETKSSIVLSSSWRTTHSGVRLVNLALQKYGMQPVIDITPDFHGGRRSEEILTWLAKNQSKYGVQNWVALDDIDLAFGCPAMAGHFVHTEGRTGLTEPLARRAIELLKRSPAVPSLTSSSTTLERSTPTRAASVSRTMDSGRSLGSSRGVITGGGAPMVSSYRSESVPRATLPTISSSRRASRTGLPPFVAK